MEAAKPGELVLTPDTVAMKVIARDGAGTDLPRLPEVTFEPPDKEHFYFLQPSIAEKDVAPLWCVQEVTDPKEANMVWGHYLVTSHIGFDFLGKPAPKPKKRVKSKDAGSSVEASCRKKAKATAGKAKAAPGKAKEAVTEEPEATGDEQKDVDNEVVRRVVRIPVLINKVALAEGEELKVHQVELQKKERKVESITMRTLRYDNLGKSS